MRQYVRSHNRWRERVVWLDKAGELAFAPGRQPEPFIQTAGGGGRHHRDQPRRATGWSTNSAGRLVAPGRRWRCSSTTATPSPALGDTLQAVRGHRMVDPLVEPGECDITAHVDFAAMARSARAAGAAVYGPIDQGDFLREIGIDTRTQALAERTPERAEEFEQARRRLVGKDDGEMGALFKAMVIANRNLPAPPGFEAAALTSAAARRRARPAGHCATPSSPARAASRRGSTPRSTAASARATRRRRSPRTAPAWRRRSALAPERLLVPYQVHSPDVATVSAPWAPDARPRCDGIVTATPGLALGVTGADCGMILFADAEARVIGAAHAGWKGARDGVVEATVAAMAALGARPPRIVAALGPCIAQASYEVGAEFVDAFAADAEAPRFFVAEPQRRPRRCSTCTAISAQRAARAGVGAFVDLGLDTYADEARFFSYRRKTHRGEPDYGRLVSAIALA